MVSSGIPGKQVILPGLVLLHFHKHHRFAMADELPATGLAHEDEVSTDITPVHFTGFLDIDHTTPSKCPPIAGFDQIHRLKGYFLYVSAVYRIWKHRSPAVLKPVNPSRIYPR
jgi:hypothetical protein